MKGQVPLWAVAGIIISFVIFAASVSAFMNSMEKTSRFMNQITEKDMLKLGFYYFNIFQNYHGILHLPHETKIEIQDYVASTNTSSIIIPEIGNLTLISNTLPILKTNSSLKFGANEHLNKGVSVFWNDTGYEKYLDDLGVNYVEVWVPGNISNIKGLQKSLLKLEESGKDVGIVVYGKNMSSVRELFERVFFARYVAFNNTKPVSINNTLVFVDKKYPDGKFKCVTEKDLNGLEFKPPMSFCMFYGKHGLINNGKKTGNYEKWKEAKVEEKKKGGGGAPISGKCANVVEFAEKYLDCPYSLNKVVPYLKPENCRGSDGLTCAMFVWNTLYYSLGAGSVGHGNGNQVCDGYPMAEKFTDLSKLQPGDVFSSEYVLRNGQFSPWGHTGIYVGRGKVSNKVSGKAYCYMKYIPDPNGDYIFIHSFGWADRQPHGVCFVPYHEMFSNSKTPGKCVLKTFCRPRKCA